MNSLIYLRVFTSSSRIKCFKTISQSITRQLSIKMSNARTTVSELQKEKEMFLGAFPSLVDTIVNGSTLSREPEVAIWMKKVLEYNVQGGKGARGLATVHSYETLAKPEHITEESLHISRIVGWCVEMMQAFFLMLDDIMDSSTKRRGLPCWYRRPEVGLGAINDSILIYATIQEILKKYCGHLPQYLSILEQFNEALLFTTMGQYLDISTERFKDDYSMFTLERYSSVVKYKTAYYTYKLPVCLGMLLANITDKEVHRQAEEICLQLGHLFQIQDDFIDCYGTEGVTGKLGTDIQERKCSWLAVQALQRCSPKQRTVFVACYGSAEPAHIERIKRLYDELNLPAIYRNEEKERYNAVFKRVQALPDNILSQKLFMNLLDDINERKQ